MATHSKELRCKDFRTDCDFSARAETEEEVMNQCQEHACTVHGRCDSSSRIRERIKSRIKDVWQ